MGGTRDSRWTSHPRHILPVKSGVRHHQKVPIAVCQASSGLSHRVHGEVTGKSSLVYSDTVLKPSNRCSRKSRTIDSHHLDCMREISPHHGRMVLNISRCEVDAPAPYTVKCPQFILFACIVRSEWVVNKTYKNNKTKQKLNVFFSSRVMCHCYFMHYNYNNNYYYQYHYYYSLSLS